MCVFESGFVFGLYGNVRPNFPNFFYHSFSWFNFVYWRLLSLFNMRALEPIPMLSVALFSSDFVGYLFSFVWLVNLPFWLLAIICTRKLCTIRNDWPRPKTVENECIRRGAVISFTVRQSFAFVKLQPKITHGRTEIGQQQHFLFLWSHADYSTFSDTSVLSYQMNNTNNAMTARRWWDWERVESVSRKSSQHLMTDILSADVILKQHFWNSAKSKGRFAFT